MLDNLILNPYKRKNREGRNEPIKRKSRSKYVCGCLRLLLYVRFFEKYTLAWEVSLSSTFLVVVVLVVLVRSFSVNLDVDAA